MADSKVSDLTAVAALDLSELLYLVDDPAGTPLDRKITLANLITKGIRQLVRKTADETVTSSTVFQNDDHLSLTIDSNEIWAFELCAWATLSSGAAGGPKTQFTAPAGSTVVHGSDGKYYNSGSTDTAGQGYVNSSSAIHFYADNIYRPVRLHGIIINGATAGTLQLQWAQDTSTAVNTVLRTGSYLMGWRIA